MQPMMEGMGAVAMNMQQLQQMQDGPGWSDGTDAINLLKATADDLTSCNNDPAMTANVCREMEMVGGVTLLCRFLTSAVTAATVGGVSAEGVQVQACRALANCLELRKTQPNWEECGRALRSSSSIALLVQLLGSDKSQIQLNAARTLNHACCNDLQTQNTMRDAGGITALSSVLSPQARDGHMEADEGLQEWAVLLAWEMQKGNIANRRAVGEAGLLNVLAQLLSTPTSEYIKLLLLRSLAEALDAQDSIEEVAVCDSNRNLLCAANITPTVAAFLQSTEASDLQAQALRLLSLLSASASLAAPILQALQLNGGDWVQQLEALIVCHTRKIIFRQIFST